MKRTHDILASVGTWKDEKGKTHKRTVAVGSVFESAKGVQVMRIDAIPVSPDWSGWLRMKSCLPELPPGRRTSPGMPPAPDEQADSSVEPDDKPF